LNKHRAVQQIEKVEVMKVKIILLFSNSETDAS